MQSSLLQSTAANFHLLRQRWLIVVPQVHITVIPQVLLLLPSIVVPPPLKEKTTQRLSIMKNSQRLLRKMQLIPLSHSGLTLRPRCTSEYGSSLTDTADRTMPSVASIQAISRFLQAQTSLKFLLLISLLSPPAQLTLQRISKYLQAVSASEALKTVRI